MKVIADEKIPFLKGVLEPFFDVEYYPGYEIASEHVKNADILIIRTRTICNADLLRGSKIKYIGTATIGYDHIDTAYCEQNNIKWFNAPGCNAFSVQQYFIAGLLFWAKENSIDLRKRTLGVVGVGNVGSKIVEFAEQLEMHVLLNDPPREEKEGPCGFISLEGVKRDADIITFHVPLTQDGQYKTMQMVNEEFINGLQNKTLLVNTSRGEVCSGEAVKLGLQNGKVQDCIFDVWENEPSIDINLLDKTFLATPHIAGYSQDGKAMGTALIINQLSTFLDLPLSDWFPEELSKPKNEVIKIDAKNKSTQDVLMEIMTLIYRIKEDDSQLRNNPLDFEKLRGDYWIRREFPAYQIQIENNHSRIPEVLRSLRFNVVD